jgi:ribose 5-phosphate isomerase
VCQQDNYIIGVGSGSTIVYAVERLGEYWSVIIFGMMEKIKLKLILYLIMG